MREVMKGKEKHSFVVQQLGVTRRKRGVWTVKNGKGKKEKEEKKGQTRKQMG